MSTPRLDEEAIFHIARQIGAPVTRKSYLQHACAGDVTLKARVEALLRIHDESRSFLESPPEGVEATLGDSITERPGTVIGAYKLLEEIGQGGFGVVFMAQQQQPIRRCVALKVIKPGMDTRQVIARFEAERQALAMMGHPNIAHVFDGGETASGRPYFVMELVRGVPITDYCDRHHLPVPQRLELFANVCQAVQHAHQKGIIHRDIKPSNILVTLHDGTPVVKVIDFGVAKAMGQQLTEKTLFTNFAQMIGTPLYMSPEQAEISGLDVDTRTDIYALGVLLYELLTGSTPFDRERLKTAAFDEIRRIIREEEPAKPSTRISTVGQAASTVSTNRQSDPERLSRLLRGELDWIVMKCLEKDRTRRYETANALARDIQRHLNGEPVEAGPPSGTYRLRKFARKHRKPIAVIGAFALLLGVGSLLSVWQAVRATQAEQTAKDERDKAVAEKERADEQARIVEAVNSFLNDALLFQTVPEGALDRKKKLRALLDRASNDIAGSPSLAPRVEARIRMTIANTYKAIGEVPAAESHALRARDLYLQHLGPDHQETLVAMDNFAEFLHAKGQLDEARLLHADTLDRMRRVLGPDHRDTVISMGNLANVLFAQEKLEEACELHQTSLESRRRLFGAEHPSTLRSMNNLAIVLDALGRRDEAHKLHEQAFDLQQRVLGAEHPLTLTSMANLANFLRYEGRGSEEYQLRCKILEIRRRVQGPEHPETLGDMFDLGMALAVLGRLDEARTLYEETLPIQRRVQGSNHPDTINTMNNLAWLLATAAEPKFRDPARALELAKEVVQLAPKSGNNWNSLGIAYFRTGDWQAAVAALEKSENLEPGKYVALNGFFLAMAHWHLGNKQKARAWYDKAVEWLDKHRPNDEELLRFRAEASKLLGSL